MGTMILKDVPDDLRNKFKSLCYAKGKTLKEEILRLMREELERREKELEREGKKDV